MNDTIISIGEALIDFIPDKINAKIKNVGSFSPAVGGAPANVAAAAAKMGMKSRILTQLGNDPFGYKIIDKLNEVRVDTSYVTLSDKGNTALAFVSLEDDGDRDFVFYRKPSADMLYSAENIRMKMFEDCYAFHFCSVSLGDFPMADACELAAIFARLKGSIICFDPNVRLNLCDNHDDLKRTINFYLPLADIVKIADNELEFITGYDDINDALEYLFREETKLVIYTCGDKGAYIYCRNGAKAYCPAEMVNAIDTTGAGDIFMAAVLTSLFNDNIAADDLENMTENQLSKYLKFASVAAGLSVQKHGAIDSYPSLDEIEKALAE